ncbi:MAG: response regulator [Lachnospiraceae bacterium]|nr:response regulator [Lachnospiraceae bacterium]
MTGNFNLKKKFLALLFAFVFATVFFAGASFNIFAADREAEGETKRRADSSAEGEIKGSDGSSAESSEKIGGGYAASGQLEGVGYIARIYDATNGLPTSDANWILGSTDGYLWIGGYSGIIRYDGTTFERLDSSGGLTSGRVIFEDSLGRIWVGTNDNGVVMIDGSESVHLTYLDGLPSSSIRSIAEAEDGRIYIGSTNGICFVDEDLKVDLFLDDRLDAKNIERLTRGADGTIYGFTNESSVFSIKNGSVTGYYTAEELGMSGILTIFADPLNEGKIYYGTDKDVVYYGDFGENVSGLTAIPVAPANGIYWISYACERIWICSEEVIGYLDEDMKYKVLDNLPMNNAIYMMTEDYQGNLWFASTRQGVMKVVANNFKHITEEAGLPEEVVNTTCLRDSLLYIGTDTGLRIVDENNKSVENALTKSLDGTRIRCIEKDGNDNLWISTYNNGHGLICYTSDEKQTNYTQEQGLTSDFVRCTTIAKDGSILTGTRDGLSVIKDGKVVRTIGASDIVTNTAFLTVEEGDNGIIYIGTDGDGIYVADGDRISKLGRDDGLTSDVILRIKWDEARKLYWIITSNSIQYMRNGIITNVSTFPYNNNFDIYYGEGDNVWIISSYGIYVLNAQEMIEDNVTDYRLYTVANGLTGSATSNSFSELDENGNLFISCRNGVSMVNINHYFDQRSRIMTGIRSFMFNDEAILPDSSGTYTIPADTGRLQISPAILDFTLSNPTVHVFLEGTKDAGITAELSNLTPLEYTGLDYGDYKLHIQIMNTGTGEVMQDEVFKIVKQPKLSELPAVRFIFLILLAAVAGFIVWRVMTGTIVRRQYNEIRQARDEAERANSAKSRFLANMSNEIRTPINTIMGMDEMILREDATDVPKGYFRSVTGYAEDIRYATESLLGLINDLLDMSKIESGKMHLVEQEYSTVDQLRAVISMIRVRSSEKDLSFEVKVDEKLPARLYGDAGKIKQIVLNLLTNAVKYTQEGGVVFSVSLEALEDDSCGLRFSVKDSGIGVKAEDMDKLFTAYERLDEEKNSSIQGTGLGLDISRRFAELLGGKLWCESVYGEGSEFILTVKQRTVGDELIGKFEEVADEELKGPYVPQFIAPDADVLVVDDNPMNLNVIKGLLKATRIFVTTASSGPDCLEKLKFSTFNLVLLDHMMPGMDGIETVARIRENYPELPVYALTANSTAGGDEFYKSKGFDGYLSKPVDSLTLEKTIMKHLPEEIMMKPGEADIASLPEEPEELPEELKWVEEVEGVSVPEGIKNSGGVSSFIESLNMFYDTLEGNAKIIENAYEGGDIKLYTVKVHSLKSSARIIGAEALSKLCQELEDAGNNEDIEFIDANTQKLLNDYYAYKDRLSRLEKKQDTSALESVDEAELKDAYEALKEVIPQMDYDSVEMILEQMSSYRLPGEDEERFNKLGKMLKTFDWDGMEALIKGL